MLQDIDVPATYSVLSGYSHGELFALWREFEVTASEDWRPSREPVLNEQSFRNAAGISTYALHPPAYRLIMNFGLDHPLWVCEDGSVESGY
jgi:hypothetical protein